MGINIFPISYPLFPIPLCLYYYYTYIYIYIYIYVYRDIGYIGHWPALGPGGQWKPVRKARDQGPYRCPFGPQMGPCCQDI